MVLNRYNFTALLLSLVVPVTAYAYEQITHRRLSTTTVENSVLSAQTSNILADFGLSTDISQESLQRFPNSKGKTQSIVQLIEDGADFEDKFPRSIQHFYDPINDQSLQHPLLNLFGGTNSSPDWALEDTGDISSQDYSYKDALDAFYQALTLPTETERDQQWGKTFETLGNVIHHIQDMAQPEHVRNDLHCGIFWGCGLPGAIVGIYDPSLFEQRSKTVFRNGIPPTLVNYPSVTFPTAREFWTTRASDPVVTNRRGLADFTNRNFISKDANFEIKNGVPAASSRYSLPVPSATNVVDLSTLDANGAGICQRLNQIGPINLPPNSPCKVEFIENLVTDSYDPAQSGTNTRAASLSLFDQYLVEYNVNSVAVEDGDTFHVMDVDRLLTINEYNIDAAHQYLIPRAVAYGAGLIDHFFRGKIDMVPDPGGQGWVIKNLSDEDMEGTFTLYYDSNQDVNGQQVILRAAIPGASWPSILIPANNEVVVGDYTVPNGLLSKTLVFSGRIGAENNLYGGKHFDGWSDPILVADTTSGGNIVVDANGRAIAIYSKYDAATQTSFLKTRDYNSTSGWGSEVTIGPVSFSTAPPNLAMDVSGNIMVIYETYDSSSETCFLWTNRYTSAGGWGSPSLIHQDGFSSFTDLSITMDVAGNAMVFYRTYYSYTDPDTSEFVVIYSLWTRRYTPAGGWSGASNIANYRFVQPSPAVMDINGDALVVYLMQTLDGEPIELSSRRYTPGGGWGSESILGTYPSPPGSLFPNFPSAAMDASGNAIAAYFLGDGAGGFDLWTNRYAQGVGWGSAISLGKISNPGLPYDYIAMNSSGSAIISYRNTAGAVAVKHFSPGGGWGGEIELSVPGQQNPSAVVAVDMDDTGKAVVLWRNQGGALYSNHYTP
mgnify:CR=1 FL=1